MEFLKTISGGAPVHQKFAVDEAMATAGVPVLQGAAGDGGLILAGVDGAADTFGVTVDTATAGAGDLITVIINPDAVWRIKLSGGSTSDTALGIGTAGASSTTDDIDNITGLTMTNYADCALWGYSGSNLGVWRNITTVTDGDTIAFKEDFPTAWSSGDEFLVAARSPGILQGISLTTDLTQADATDENTSAAEYIVLDGEFNDQGNEGTTNSFLHIVSTDHVFAS